MGTALLFTAFFTPASDLDFSAFDNPAPPTPEVRPEPPKPQPQPTTEQYEYRLINGQLYRVPVGTPWPSTTTFPLQQTCPTGTCPAPGRR